MGLEEEISNSWNELQAHHESGRLELFRQSLEEQGACGSSQDVEKDSEVIEEIKGKTRKYLGLGEPPENHSDSYSSLLEVDTLLNERLIQKKKCVDKHLFDIQTDHELGLLTSEKALEKLEELRSLSTASQNLHYDEGYIRSQNLMETLVKDALIDENERFQTSEIQQRYDEEYHILKLEFDEIEPDSKSDLKELRRLAIRSQHLTEKYKSISDEEGITYSARLHEDIEEAAERLAPIYDSWKLKKITIGLLLVTAGLGFWKGDYIKNQIFEFFGRNEEEIRQQVYLPQSVGVAMAQHPEATHAIYFNIGELNGDLYDLIEREEEFRFPFTASLLNTPEGTFKVERYGQGINTPANMGAAYIQLEGIDSVFISGTIDQNITAGIDENRYLSQKNIVLKDNDMIELYSQLTGSLEETIIVIEK